VQFEVQPALEWHQILIELWRHARDNFSTETVNGLDWDLLLSKYQLFCPELALGLSSLIL